MFEQYNVFNQMFFYTQKKFKLFEYSPCAELAWQQSSLRKHCRGVYQDSP